jgi:hypothetical protein
LSLEDFELIKVIGKGGFSKVFQGNSTNVCITCVNSEEEGYRENLRYEDSKQSQDKA